MGTQNLHRLGIDIGSTTVKIAILNQENEIIFADYERHFANIRETLSDLLSKAQDALGNIYLSPMITGSGGLTLAKHLEIPFVQEVIAVSAALQDYAPQTDVAIELGGEDAKQLLANGVKIVAEVSNMGCRPEAIDAFIAAKIPYGPGKAVNAGGVATSGLEMTQNSQKLNWTAEEVDAKLHQIMSSIHGACLEYGTEKDGYINYMKGANIAGFMKVAKSMVEQGIL